jgi:hypothetical protein
MLGHSVKNLTSCLHMTSRSLPHDEVCLSWFDIMILSMTSEMRLLIIMSFISCPQVVNLSCQSPLVTGDILAVVNLHILSKEKPRPMF